ncbi:TetR-like C-terminal domain-containing protein [Streptomyces sp. NPDC101733]|uniref:TetR-like C-terminal domain-containing protein n=1 Tax=unclassified Streptomyces TaxID=2593676 RepID=UPI0038159DA5
MDVPDPSGTSSPQENTAPEDAAGTRDKEAEAVRRAALARLPRRRLVDLDLDDLAREAGVDGSAVHKTYPGEWDLLTDLVMGAYNAMGDAAERAAGPDADQEPSPLAEWVAVCRNVRRWALDHPHEYALIWAAPVPGYSAPPETMAAGARTVLALLAPLRRALAAGTLAAHAEDPELSEGMRRNVEPLTGGLLAGLPDPVVARMLTAWTQLHGMLGFEVYGHIAGVAADPEAFYTYSATAMGAHVGLPRAPHAGHPPTQ